jgi:pilus assembly protein Flp/PilA
MWPGYLRIVCRLQCLLLREEGQDLVEYALIIAMLAVTVTAASQSMANALTTGLITIAARFSGAI